MKIQSIDPEIIKAYFHSGQPDIPKKSAHEMKEFFDAMPKKVLIPKINEVVDELNSGGYGKSAYVIACERGFEGTEDEWLSSLKGEKGLQGPQGEKGDPVVINLESPDEITEEGIYLIGGEYYLASPKSWDTDPYATVEYIGDMQQISKINFNNDDSSILYADKIQFKESDWGFPLLKYQNIRVDATGISYLLLRWDLTTLLVYESDTADGVPMYIGSHDLLGDNKFILAYIGNNYIVGKGEDICGNFAKISRFLKCEGLSIDRLVTQSSIEKLETQRSEFSNVLKGYKTSTAVFLDDVCPIEHPISIKTELPQETVTRYGKNLFDDNQMTKANNWTFANGEYSGKLRDLSTTFGEKFDVPDFVRNQQYTFSVDASVSARGVTPSIAFEYTDGTSDIFKFFEYDIIYKTRYTFTTAKGKSVKRMYFLYTEEEAVMCWSNIQLEACDRESDYTPFYSKQFTSDSEGNVADIIGNGESMSLVSNGIMTVQYNRDINKVISKLEG